MADRKNEKSGFAPVEGTRLYYEVSGDGQPRARKVVLPGTAHYPPLEQPGPFDELILNFLNKVVE